MLGYVPRTNLKQRSQAKKSDVMFILVILTSDLLAM
jgi:hypothetical protein